MSVAFSALVLKHNSKGASRIDSVNSVAIDGFAMIRGLSEGSPSWEVAQEFGIIDEVEGLNPTQTLIPRAKCEAPPNTYSGNFGRAEFPLHTDLAHWALPPHYLLLRCIRGAPSVSTRLLDGQSIVAKIGAERLRSTLVQPRRPMHNGKQLLRLLGRSHARSCDILRWDCIYLRPASPASARTFGEVVELLSVSPYAEINLLEPGDTLLIDNWRFLHGRSQAGEEAEKRHIERVYLKELT